MGTTPEESPDPSLPSSSASCPGGVSIALAEDSSNKTVPASWFNNFRLDQRLDPFFFLFCFFFVLFYKRRPLFWPTTARHARGHFWSPESGFKGQNKRRVICAQNKNFIGKAVEVTEENLLLFWLRSPELGGACNMKITGDTRKNVLSGPAHF